MAKLECRFVNVGRFRDHAVDCGCIAYSVCETEDDDLELTLCEFVVKPVCISCHQRVELLLEIVCYIKRFLYSVFLLWSVEIIEADYRCQECWVDVASFGDHATKIRCGVCVQLSDYCVRRTVLVHCGRIDLLHLGLLVFLVDELFRFFFREADDADFHWVVEVWMFLEDFGEGDVAVVTVEGRGRVFCDLG